MCGKSSRGEKLRRWFHDRINRREFRAEADAKAEALLIAYGHEAYGVARAEARRGQHGNRDSFWTAVAKAIAKREGREIGFTGADRFLRG